MGRKFSAFESAIRSQRDRLLSPFTALSWGIEGYSQRGFAAKSKGKRQKSKGKNLCAGPRAGLGRNLQELAAIKTIVNDSIVNDSILERRRKLVTSRNLRGAQRNGTLVVQGRTSPKKPEVNALRRRL